MEVISEILSLAIVDYLLHFVISFSSCFIESTYGSPGSSVRKETACDAEVLGLISGLGTSGKEMGICPSILAWKSQ